MKILLFLFLVFNLNFSNAQESMDSLWGDISLITEQLESTTLREASKVQVESIQANVNSILNNPTVDHSQQASSIIKAFKAIQTSLNSTDDEVANLIISELQTALFLNTVGPVLLGTTEKSLKESYFKSLGFNLNSKQSTNINIKELGFSSLVISENSTNYLSLEVETSIADLVGGELTSGEFVLAAVGGVVLESSDGKSIYVPMLSGQSAEVKSGYVSLLSGKVLGKNLDLNQNYKPKKIVTIFENEKGENLYKVESFQPTGLHTLKAIDTGLLDFISNSEYAVSYKKFQEAVERGNVIPFDDGNNFMVRAGEHSIGIMHWKEQELFAFYRCHNDNYADKIINAENCWIIKAPRNSLPSGFEMTPYMGLGVYKIMELKNSPITNLDYLLNRITVKLNHGQAVMFKHSDKIFANGEQRLEAIRNTRNYHNLIDGVYDNHAKFFEDTMRYSYYFAAGASAGAVIDVVTKKLVNKLHGYKPDNRFKPKLAGQINRFSLSGFYKTSLKYGGYIFGGSLVLYFVNRSKAKFDRYMMEHELSLDLFLTMQEEFKEYPNDSEYFIKANKNLVNVIHSAIIDSLIEYNKEEQKEALDISKENCEKFYGINCSEQMIRSLYPEGA